MEFERWKLRQKYSWAFNVFKRHHTEINDIYWSFATGKKYLNLNLKSINRNTPASTIFKNCISNPNKLPKTVGVWNEHYVELENWLRLNCLMAASAYLETYINKSTRLALVSDPGVLWGLGKTIDGVKILKVNEEIDFYFKKHLEGLVKGSWKKRIQNFEKIFKKQLTNTEKALVQLEKLRKLRNDVGHAFGRDLDGLTHIEFMKFSKAKRLNEKDLMSYLEIVDRVAREYESILAPHIGEFEAIYFYHESNFKNWRLPHDRANRLKKILTNEGFTVPREFTYQLIIYYENL